MVAVSKIFTIGHDGLALVVVDLKDRQDEHENETPRVRMMRTPRVETFERGAFFIWRNLKGNHFNRATRLVASWRKPVAPSKITFTKYAPLLTIVPALFLPSQSKYL